MPLPDNLKNEIATIEKDTLYSAGFFGLLRPEDSTLLSRGGGKGLRIYDELKRDCRAYAVLNKRKTAVISREWIVEPASQGRLDKKAADVVKAQLMAIKFDRVCYKLLDAVLKGYAVGEVIWNTDGAGIFAEAVKVRRAERFVFDTGKNLRLVTWAAPLLGEPLPERKFVVVRHGADHDDNPYGVGLGHQLFWPVFFKRKGITFWLTFCDKFGSPTAVGKYQPGVGTEDKQKLLEALGAIAQDAGVIIPEGMSIELLEAARSGSVNTYESLCRYMDEQISECVLGETLTTNVGDAGSRAASQTHNEVRLEVAKGDADLLSDTVNETLVKWITEFNVPGAAPPKVWRNFEEEDDLAARAVVDKTIFDMGFDPSEEYINETYGGQWKKRGAEDKRSAQAVREPVQGQSFAEPQTTFPDQQAVDDAVDGLSAEELQEQIEGVLKPIVDMLEEGEDYNSILAALAGAYPNMDDKAIEEMLSRAIFVTEAWGRLNSRN